MLTLAATLRAARHLFFCYRLYAFVHEFGALAVVFSRCAFRTLFIVFFSFWCQQSHSVFLSRTNITIQAGAAAGEKNNPATFSNAHIVTFTAQPHPCGRLN
jgi:hypothetical protein